MKPTVKLINDENDFLTGWRKYVKHRTGQIKQAQRRYWHRVRAMWKRKFKEEHNES